MEKVGSEMLNKWNTQVYKALNNLTGIWNHAEDGNSLQIDMYIQGNPNKHRSKALGGNLQSES